MVADLQIEYVGIDALNPYSRNPRKHSDEQIDEIIGSFKQFGFVNPILVRDDGTIIAGHGRFKAAQRMDMPRVPVLRLSHLTDTQARALVIADNNLALNSGWNAEMLSLELASLSEESFDMGLLGFRDSLDEWLAIAGTAPMPDTDIPEEADRSAFDDEKDQDLIRGDIERIVLIVDKPDFIEASKIITRIKEQHGFDNVTKVFLYLLGDWDANN